MTRVGSINHDWFPPLVLSFLWASLTHRASSHGAFRHISFAASFPVILFTFWSFFPDWHLPRCHYCLPRRSFWSWWHRGQSTAWCLGKGCVKECEEVWQMKGFASVYTGRVGFRLARYTRFGEYLKAFRRFDDKGMGSIGEITEGILKGPFDCYIWGISVSFVLGKDLRATHPLIFWWASNADGCDIYDVSVLTMNPIRRVGKSNVLKKFRGCEMSRICKGWIKLDCEWREY